MFFSFNFFTKKLFFLPPPHKIIFPLSRFFALITEIIISLVNPVKVAAPSSNERFFTYEKSKYFVSNDWVGVLVKGFFFFIEIF